MKRLFIVSTFVIVVFGGVAFLLLQPSDAVSRRKVAFAELINQLASARKAGDLLFKEKGSLAGISEVEQAALPSDDTNRYFKATAGGELVAIDFKKQVAVFLSPTIQTAGLEWRCETLPRNSAPKLCNRTRDKNDKEPALN